MALEDQHYTKIDLQTGGHADITAANITLGTNSAFNKSFGGDGGADSVSRSDHTHPGLRGKFIRSITPEGGGSIVLSDKLFSNGDIGTKPVTFITTATTSITGTAVIDAQIAFSLVRGTEDHMGGNTLRPNDSVFAYVSNVSISLEYRIDSTTTATIPAASESHAYAFVNPSGSDSDLSHHIRVLGSFAGMDTKDYNVKIIVTFRGRDESGSNSLLIFTSGGAGLANSSCCVVDN